MALHAEERLALSCRAVAEQDPIRKLLNGVAPSMFLGNPPGTVAFLEERIVDRGGDPAEVRAWVEGHGGYHDKTFSIVGARAQDRYHGPVGKLYFVVPEDALR